MKPGIKTTEFWITLGTVVVSLMTIVGVIDPTDQAGFADAVTKIVLGVVSTITAATYIVGRVKLKE